MVNKHEFFTNKYSKDKETAEEFTTYAQAEENEKFYDAIVEYGKKYEDGSAEFRMNGRGEKEYFTGALDKIGQKIFDNDIVQIDGESYHVHVTRQNNWWVLITSDFFERFARVTKGKVVGRLEKRIFIPTPIKYDPRDIQRNKTVLDGGSCDDGGSFVSSCMMSAAISSCF
jgi:hypothetical protein